MKSTVLITGGLGYIGSHIAVHLLQQKYKIIILDEAAGTQQGKKIGQQITNVASYGQYIEPVIINGTTADAELLNTIFKKYAVDAIIHCAAYSNVQESITNPQKYYRN